MKLENKKDLAAKTLGVGKDRIIFNNLMLSEIKEAITKQDIRDLFEAGAIHIKEIKGRRTQVQKKTRRRLGSIRKKVNKSKREYMTLTRKFRSHLADLKRKNLITQDKYLKIRREIRARAFKSKSHLKERLAHKDN